MKRRIFVAGSIFLLALSAGLAHGQSTVTDTRDLKGFTKVSFGVAGNLTVNLGPEFKVVLEGDKAVVDNIITEVKGDRLIIRNENWRLHINGNVNINITMPEMKALGVSGSGRAEIKDEVKTDALGLSVSGSGRLYTAGLDVSSLECTISGSGDIIPGEGKAGKGDISISGSGNYDGESTKIGTLGVSISGSGNCHCNATESLKASVSGSGNIIYVGSPRIDARVSGSGKVRSR